MSQFGRGFGRSPWETHQLGRSKLRGPQLGELQSCQVRDTVYDFDTNYAGSGQCQVTNIRTGMTEGIAPPCPGGVPPCSGAPVVPPPALQPPPEAVQPPPTPGVPPIPTVPIQPPSPGPTPVQLTPPAAPPGPSPVPLTPAPGPSPVLTRPIVPPGVTAPEPRLPLPLYTGPQPGRRIGISTGVRQIISKWPRRSREVAEQMIQKYGNPNEACASKLTWFNNGPWKETIVYRDEVPHNWPKPHTDVLEQTIDYMVPPETAGELEEFDGSVWAKRTKGTLSAMCDYEEANYLAINLSDDIVKGEKSVDEAREYYENAIRNYMDGTMDPYMEGLKFEAAAEPTGDPDEAVL